MFEELQSIFAEDIAATERFDDLYKSQARIAPPILAGAELPLQFWTAELDWGDVLGVLAQLYSVPAPTRAAMAEGFFEDLQQAHAIRFEDYPTMTDMLLEEAIGRGFELLVPPSTPDEIWPLLRFTSVYVDKALAPDTLNVVLVAETAWDMEHQTGAFFRNGATLVAVAEPSTGI